MRELPHMLQAGKLQQLWCRMPPHLQWWLHLQRPLHLQALLSAMALFCGGCVASRPAHSARVQPCTLRVSQSRTGPSQMRLSTSLLLWMAMPGASTFTGCSPGLRTHRTSNRSPSRGRDSGSTSAVATSTSSRSRPTAMAPSCSSAVSARSATSNPAWMVRDLSITTHPHIIQRGTCGEKWLSILTQCTASRCMPHAIQDIRRCILARHALNCYFFLVLCVRVCVEGPSVLFPHKSRIVINSV